MDLSRRDFLTTAAGAVGGLVFAPGGQLHPSAMTIQDVIDRVLQNHPADPRSDTVDTVKMGDPSQAVTGVAVTFMATSVVIQQTIARGLNLVITHEPTFYNHRDEVEWLRSDPVYEAKTRMIRENGLVVWRLHDHLHRPIRDDITRGVFRTLGWQESADPDDNYVCNLPGSTLAEMAAHLKVRLGTHSVRMTGDPGMMCRRVGVLMGAWGGRRQIEMISRPDIDALVCGETPEWETPEYVRDANVMGISKGLLVTGHAVSEEPGMRWFAEWLKAEIPGVDVAHLPAGDPFSYV